MIRPPRTPNKHCGTSVGGEGDGRKWGSTPAALRSNNKKNKEKAMETTKKEELTRVQRGDFAYNFINKNGKFLSNEWFHWADDFKAGLAVVQRSNGLWNFINKKGKLLSDEWFKRLDYFKDGFAEVQRTNGELCKIDKSGKLYKD